MSTMVLTIPAIITAIIHLWGEYRGPPILIYIFKPLTMVFIIAIALRASTPPRRRYKYAVLAGLVFSLGGDIFLMLPVDLFIPWIARTLFPFSRLPRWAVISIVSRLFDSLTAAGELLFQSGLPGAFRFAMTSPFR